MTTFDLHEGDALSFLRDRVPSDSIDLICTDPPYASLEKHRKTGTTTRLKVSKSSSNVWFPVIQNDVLVDHAKEWLRVLKPGRHLYLLCDPETSYDIVPQLKAAGWVWGNRLIWNKGWIGMGYHYRRKYEDVLFFTKAPKGTVKKRRLRDLGMADVLDKPEYRALKGEGFFPTEKPVPLLAALIRQSTEPSELVLDPFCGSGSTGEAALINGCRFQGIDVTPEAIRRTTARLQGFQPGSQPLPAPEPIPEAPEEEDEAPEPIQAAPAPRASPGSRRTTE
jgi:site-specific DNA-methyltransferase (adenine-specific)